MSDHDCWLIVAAHELQMQFQAVMTVWPLGAHELPVEERRPTRGYIIEGLVAGV